jgi:outer membrane autotransporter protein
LRGLCDSALVSIGSALLAALVATAAHAQNFASAADSRNERAVGGYLDNASGMNPSSEFQAYLDSLSTLGSSATSDALDSLHPEVFDAHTSASFATANGFANLLAARQPRCEQLAAPSRKGFNSSEPCSENGWTAWASTFGGFAERDGSSGHSDWTYGGGGLAVGADLEINDAFFVSAMLGASRLVLRYGGDGDGSATSLDLGVAVGWQHEGTHVRGIVEYGHGWHHSRRKVENMAQWSELNVSDYDSDRVTLLVEGGHEFRFGAIDLEPLVSVEYTYLYEDSTSESKNNVSALSIGSRSNTLIATEAGVRVGTMLIKHADMGALMNWADGVWRPEVTMRWRQILSDYDRASSAELRAAPSSTPKFRTKSEDAQYGGELGVAVNFQPHESRSTIQVGYETFIGDRTTTHTVMGTFRIPF